MSQHPGGKYLHCNAILSSLIPFAICPRQHVSGAVDIPRAVRISAIDIHFILYSDPENTYPTETSSDPQTARDWVMSAGRGVLIGPHDG